MEPRRPGLITKAVTYVTATAALAWQKATNDGMLAAAGRQGLDEIGAALKAFPESIQMHEPGTIGNPTQGEVAASRRPHEFGRGHGRSPSEIAADRGVHGKAQEQGKQATKSPSEIAAERGRPGVDRGQERERDLGLEM
jgi:hypothetical protein